MGGIAALRDRQPLPAAGRSRSAGWTRSTTACSSAPRRRASRSSAGNVARRARPIVVDVTLLGDAGRLLLRTGAQPGRPRGRHGHARRRGRGRAPARARARASTRTASSRRPASGRSRRRPRCLRCLRAQLDPRPPLALARSIAERGLAHAGMDLSDGLSSDLARDLRRERRRRRRSTPPRCRSTRARRASSGRAAATPLALALHGGEDYQLLLAVAPGRARRAVASWRGCGASRSPRSASSWRGSPRSCASATRRGERPLVAARARPLPRVGRLRRRGCAGMRLAARGSAQILLHVDDSPTRVAARVRARRLHRLLPAPRHPHRASRSASRSLFRLNKVAILIGAWINNPWTVAPMYTAGTLARLRAPRRLAGEPRRAIDWSLQRPRVLRGARRRAPAAAAALRRRQPGRWASVGGRRCLPRCCARLPRAPAGAAAGAAGARQPRRPVRRPAARARGAASRAGRPAPARSSVASSNGAAEELQADGQAARRGRRAARAPGGRRGSPAR